MSYSRAETLLQMAFSDSFATEIPSDYQVQGAVHAAQGLHLAPRTGVIRNLDGSSLANVRFRLDEPDASSTDYKLQVQIYTGEIFNQRSDCPKRGKKQGPDIWLSERPSPRRIPRI